MAKSKWNIETMQQYCDENNTNYIVLDSKIIEKPYQKQLWSYMKCGNKGHKPYWVMWNSFHKGHRCKECDCDNKNITRWDEEKAYSYIKENGYVPLECGLFKNVDSPIPCRDKNGYIYMISLTNLKRSIKNNKMNFSIVKNNPYAIENIKLFCKLERPEYEYVKGEYKTIKSVVVWRYLGKFYDEKEHNRDFECSVDSFINAFTKHPDLTSSSLELKMREILDDLGIVYETEKTFEDCLYRIKLRFDFYFAINNHEICIETDGEQHFRPVESWGGQKYYLEIKERDNIKNDYCKKNNIVLIRIPYNKINEAKNIILNYIKEFDISTLTPYRVGA